jgi:formylglycine-generating enzyme required for sulfatase activity
MLKSLVASACVVLLPLMASAVTMEMVPVGDPGNAPDPLNTNAVPGIGSVAYTYAIGKYEVKNSEYVGFLNSVAATDTYGLYSSSMNSDARGGIVQSGSSGSYTYAAKPGYENMPVVFVSFYDAARFVNWLENGQGGAETTEYGSYTLFTDGSNNTTNISARAANATWVIPTENEWYKAAYYDPTASGTTNYWLYPTQSDSIPNSRPPNSTDANSANFYRNDSLPGDFLNDGHAVTGSPSFEDTTNYLTDVGSYVLADSYFGTFDQGGNVSEWNEWVSNESHRGFRGSHWDNGEFFLQSSIRNSRLPTYATSAVGFRVAFIPEPCTFVVFGLAGLAACVWRRRQR